MNVMTRRKIVAYIVMIVLLAAAAVFLYKYREKIGRIMTPFFLAVIIAYLLHPLVVKLEVKNIPRKTGILLIYLIFTGLLASTGIFLVPELISNTKELMRTLPEIITGYQGIFNGIISSVRTSKWSGEIKDMIFMEVQNLGAAAQDYVANILKRSLNVFVNTVTMLFDFLLALVIAYYFIKDADFFKSFIMSLAPRRWRNGIERTGKEINAILSNFIQGQLLTALIVGVLETIGLIIVGVKYSFILGVVGGLANVIPYFGPIIGAIPAVAVALIESPMKAVFTILVFAVVQQLDNTFISPKIIEGRLGLHPVTTIFAVLAGGEFFGILGMLIAVPVAAILRVLLKRTIEAIV